MLEAKEVERGSVSKVIGFRGGPNGRLFGCVGWVVRRVGGKWVLVGKEH